MQLTYIPEWLSGNLAKALSWTLIHSLWQGLIAAVIAGLIVSCTRHSKAQLRYNLLSGLFALFLLVSAVTFFIEYDTQKHRPSVPLPDLASLNSALHSFSTSKVDILFETSAYPDQLVSYFNENASIIVLTWFFFFFVRCVKLIKGMWQGHRLCNVDVHYPSKSWLKKLRQLKQKLGIENKVRLLESKHIKVPMTLGYLKATILVPIGMLVNLPSDQVASILLHELAHIKRKDYLVNFMQSLAETVLFFNPAVLWVSSLIREEREACCDDMVVENLAEKRSYLEALVSFQEYTMGAGTYAVGLAGRKNFLLTRVKRLLTQENKKLNFVEKSILLLSVFTITAFAFIKQDSNDVKQLVFVQNKSMLPAPSKEPVRQYAAAHQMTPDATPAKKSAKSKLMVPDSGFTEVRFDKTNDPRAPVHTYEIKDTDANAFRITRERDQMVALSVNDRQIPSGQLSNYQDLYERAEAFIRKRSAEKRKSISARMVDRTHTSTMEDDSIEKNSKEPVDQAGHKPDKKESRNNQDSLGRISYKPEKKKDFTPDENCVNNVARIKGVLEELVKEGVVASTSSVEWFGINNAKMMVNGKAVSEALYHKLKSAYQIEEGKGLFYGPSQMHGPGVYFDKKDLN
jgi:bla regulator protein blaR1